ncbi:probable bifunctional dTTP/UTP pyrophosphatase/methyltransferase protein [Latimeria chalumnae]|uniref:Acetylserotonin O-methyltransferase like n=1 Tax=Latimeria chalumnae TaxID=7897 RepID=H3AIK0_LATCH|nr:PREDICTED: N-acetylserotonin O-methyltransferase-like protein [Latimeria chalumnae]|eukprot:XP_005997259.1 PREDICTED: N-acetylserotonin O-methyltransferase-like protein [Latimeria chalumnae]
MVLNPAISKLVGKRVVLASGSPRRREILTNVGLRFEVVPSWFKETLEKSSFAVPFEYAIETAKQKALEVARRMQVKHFKTPDIVIGADTIVTVEGEILEKPCDKQDAYRMLSRLNGKEHSVFTGVAIVHCNGETENELETDVIDFYEETKVKFADLSEELLWEYIHSGEPMDKAGGYGIQALGGMLVEYVHGDFLNVVGFPLNHFCKKLAEIYNPPSKSMIKRTKCDSIPAVETFDNPADLGNGFMGSEVETEQRRSAGEGSCAGNGKVGNPTWNWTSQHVAEKLAPSCTADKSVAFPRKLVDLIDGFRASKALFVASKLRIFDLLKSHSGLKALEVAKLLDASVCGVERLLDVCVALSLLEKTYQKDSYMYNNTELASTYLVSDGMYSLEAYILRSDDCFWPLFTHLESAVKEGASQCERAFGKTKEESFQGSCLKDNKEKDLFLPAMHSIARIAGKDVATAFDLSQFKTACDLGGCTGALAYELVNAYPDMRVTVFDLPVVISKCGHFEFLGQQTNRVSFTGGDFFEDRIPQADLYILSRVLHDLSEDKVDALLGKLSEICKPGCGLLVAETALNEDKRKPIRVLLQSLSMGKGKQRSSSEYRQLLEKYEFTNVLVKYTGNFLDAILGIKK